MRQEKQLLLDAIKDAIGNSQAFVLSSYEKIDANMTADFRADLRSVGGEHIAVKKRVFLKAAESCGIEFDANQLDGHITVSLLGDNIVDSAKKLYAFQEGHEEQFKILAGHYEGKIVTAKEIEQISKLPSQNVMRAQLLSVFEAPLANTLSVMQALLTSVMHCLENKAQKEETKA